MYYSLFSLAALILLLQVAQQTLPELAITASLEYNKVAISQGHWWKALTGHLVHNNGYHSLMNLAAMGVLAIVFKSQDKRSTWREFEFIAVCVTAMVIISAGLFFCVSSIEFYVGFSGVLHCLFLYYFIKHFHDDRILFGIAIAAIIAKVIWEQTPWYDSSSTAMLIETRVATQAHLFGCISAIILASITLGFYLFKKTKA